MSIHGATRSTGATVLGRALEAKGDGMPPDGARFILSLGIREADRLRCLELLERNREGSITEEAKGELDAYIEAHNILSLFKATALRALKRAGQNP